MAKLLTVCLFGSEARGDSDELSDVDVLAIVESRSGRVLDEEVWTHLPNKLRIKDPTISWYGSDRFAAMSAAGTLFSWHIFLDGQALFDPNEFLCRLGAPAPYTQALEDIDAFLEIARGVVPQVSASASNSVYELGLLYVCARNVAMSGSAVLSSKPDFSRDSPFRLRSSLDAFGVDRAAYHRAMLCRLASQRGLDPPTGIDAEEVFRYYLGAAEWMRVIRQQVATGG